ncbi:MAG: formate dehydrogenase accessory sulfurtransferase FdhD [Anaerolineales bacterium]|nr:formate dehydrogenase accessory sulfurtransferase FdhD [Anaerolineales bacterium]
MISPRESVRFQQFRDNSYNTLNGNVIVEMPVSLTINGQPWLEFMCTPVDLKAMAAGFLFNENLIDGLDDIVDIRVCEKADNIDVWLMKDIQKPSAWIHTAGCTGGITSIGYLSSKEKDLHSTDMVLPENGCLLPPEQIHNLLKKLFESQKLYRETGGIHISALSDGQQIIVSAEDIGRHNSLDKIAGVCLLENKWPDRRILLTSGRTSSEMLQKSARMGAAIVISCTSPSSLSIRMANTWGITLIGYARQEQFNIYTHPERIAQPIPKAAK